MATKLKKTKATEAVAITENTVSITIPDSLIPHLELIRGDIAIAIEGTAAFIRVGLRLVVVKNNCPHGQFKDVLSGYFGLGSQRWLYNAKRCAENILESHGYDKKSVYELADSEVAALADTVKDMSQRELLADAKGQGKHNIETHDGTGKSYEELVRPILEEDPELLDEWIERVELGETSWYHAWQALINGKDNAPADGQSWYNEGYTYVWKAMRSIRNWLPKTDWDAVDPDLMPDIMTCLGEVFEGLPPTLKTYVIGLMKKADKQ